MHAVDLAAERDRLHVHHFGQSGLVQRLFVEFLGAGHGREDAPLGAGHADRLRLMINATAQQATDIVHQEPNALGRWEMILHNERHNKQTHYVQACKYVTAAMR